MERCCVCGDRVSANYYSKTWQVCMPCLHTAREIASHKDTTIARELMEMGIAMSKARETSDKKCNDDKIPKKPDDATCNLGEVPKKVRAKKVKPVFDEDGSPISPKRSRKYSNSEYTKMEYAHSMHIVQGETDESEVFRLQQLLDIALLGGDIEWARKLNNQIIMTKGQMN